jgi:predicted acylesterase/phospholipase RssA
MGPQQGTNRRNVAIACQGGGAQTAFTAGALSWLLKHYEPENKTKPYRIVALSGTSGGAVCASLAWHDLLLGNPVMNEPTVERFWKTGYPDGNAALPFAQAITADILDFVNHGRLPWLHTADRLRAELGLIVIQMPSILMAATPADVIMELKPYYFNDLFKQIDAATMPFMVGPMFDLIGAQLKTMRGIPGCYRAANFIGDVLDLIPLHENSVIRDGERAIIRRECDVQDAFRAVLKKYFTAAEMERIRTRLAEAKEEKLPELLIGAADAEHVQDGGGDRVRRELGAERRQALEGPPDTAVQAAKTLALRLEEHACHLASYTNLRTLRGSEHLDDLVDCIIASAAIPVVMRGVELEHTVLWDGLYSSNPPIYDLPDVHGEGQDTLNPDEIWVIRINPTEIYDRPDTPAEIVDRRNELAGNLPLTQEIRTVVQIGGAKKGNRTYKPVTFGFIDMSEDRAAALDYPTKLDKRLEPVTELFQDGEVQMQRFYERWLAAA